MSFTAEQAAEPAIVPVDWAHFIEGHGHAHPCHRFNGMSYSPFASRLVCWALRVNKLGRFMTRGALSRPIGVLAALLPIVVVATGNGHPTDHHEAKGAPDAGTAAEDDPTWDLGCKTPEEAKAVDRDCLTPEDFAEAAQLQEENERERRAYADGGTFYVGGHRVDVEVQEGRKITRLYVSGRLSRSTTDFENGDSVSEGDFDSGKPHSWDRTKVSADRIVQTQQWDTNGDGVVDRERIETRIMGEGIVRFSEIEYDNSRGQHRVLSKEEGTRSVVTR
jgi:hypothetical protein